MKKDAIPGFVNELWIHVEENETGTYRGQCAELCGRDHGFMPIVVEVKSKEDFKAWLSAEQEKARQAATPAAEPVASNDSDAPATAVAANTEQPQ
jgi:cytochrome c oxidase subunit 2